MHTITVTAKFSDGTGGVSIDCTLTVLPDCIAAEVINSPTGIFLVSYSYEEGTFLMKSDLVSDMTHCPMVYSSCETETSVHNWCEFFDDQTGEWSLDTTTLAFIPTKSSWPAN